MKNKKTMALLSLVFASAFLLSACGGNETLTPTSSDPTTSTSIPDEPLPQYTVKFVVEGEVVQTSLVEEGSLAVYEGPTPTKENDDPSILYYGFHGWDRRLTDPIMEDTTFNAVFGSYVDEMLLDDFESYTSSGRMKEAGWTALGYSNSTGQWTTETSAAVGLTDLSLAGNNALRFDAWENGVGYKIANTKLKDKFTHSANALKFGLMCPEINTIKVIIYTKMITITDSDGSPKLVEPKFLYQMQPSSNEYVEYTLPFNSEKWLLWEKAGDTMVAMANWLNMHQDDITTMLTKIEFYIVGNDGVGRAYSSYLDSVKFVTLENPQYEEVELDSPYSCYTGTLTNNQTVKIDLKAENAATATIVDAQVPQVINGTYALNGKNISFTSADSGATLVYNGKITHNGKQVDYVSADGALKEYVEGVKLNSVQPVENFESFDSDGVAYTQEHAADAREGARGSFYSEFYSGNGTDSSPWAGKNWSLLEGDGDELQLVQDNAVAHSGNNCLKLENNKQHAIRYMQWGLFDGTSKAHIYHGSTLSFWAKSVGAVPMLKVLMYSENKPAHSSTMVVSDYFAGPVPNGGWKHYELKLKDVNYYGFAIVIEKNLTANSTLYVDDFEIYTASPYATYVAPTADPGFAIGSVFNGAAHDLINISLEIIDANVVKFSCQKLGSPVNGTYVKNNDTVTMTFGSTIYVATIQTGYSGLKFSSITGSDEVAQLLNNVSFTALDQAETAETYLSNGQMYCQSNMDEDNVSGARGAYYCDFKGGGGSSPLGGCYYSLMGGSGDQLSLDNSTAASGNNSIMIKKNRDYDMRYFQWGLFKGTGKAHKGFDAFSIYLKNDNAFVTKVKVYVYSLAKLNTENHLNGRVTKEINLPANQDWTKYTLSLDTSKTYYGFAIELPAEEGGANGSIHFDNAYYHSTEYDPSLIYRVKKDTTLSGLIYQNSNASIKFLGDGKILFTSEKFSALNNQECPYTMEVVGTEQIMSFEIQATVVTGKYAVDIATGVITFTVTSAEGGLYYGAIPPGSVFRS